MQSPFKVEVPYNTNTFKDLKCYLLGVNDPEQFFNQADALLFANKYLNRVK